MLLKLDNPKLLVDVISLISELVTEVRIKVTLEGLSIVAIDPANVALVSFKLPAQSFSQLEAKDETIGINLDSLKSVLRRASTGSNLIMRTDENSLVVDIEDKIRRTFTIALIDIEKEEKAVPILEFTNKVEMVTSDFADVVEDCAVVADSCSFIIQQGKFLIEARGLNSTKSEFSTDEAKIEGSDGKSRYSLEYLMKFIKAGKISDKVLIRFANDYPLRLDFKNMNIELSFILAPRVETED
jgi:proliferating cell nuclear antigen